MSDTSLVRAQHKNGEIREIPQFWLGENSPFPGNWTEVKEPAAKKREEVEVPSILDEPDKPKSRRSSGSNTDKTGA